MSTSLPVRSVAAVLAVCLAAPAAAQVTLQYESLIGDPAQLEVTPDCDTFGTSTITYTVRGTAGDPFGNPVPFPGTFTETGTLTVGPQWDENGVFRAGEILSFHAEFTIFSGDRVVTGSKSLIPQPLLATNEAICFDAQTSFGVAAAYEALLPTPEGGTVLERGESSAAMNVYWFEPVESWDFLEQYVNVLPPAPRAVRVDIKPGSDPNAINLGAGGNVPVAIFGEAGWDATAIDPETVTLASAPVRLRGNGTPQASAIDVDGDGLLDLVVHVDTSTLVLLDADVQAVVRGSTLDGAAFEGTDTVRVVP